MNICTLENDTLSLSLGSFGARILSVIAKQSALGRIELVKGYEEANDYLDDTRYRGAIIAPLTNRIPYGRLSIHGLDYDLPVNEGKHTLHSGGKAVDKENWTLVDQSDNEATFVLTFDLTKLGLPGEMLLKAQYSLIAKSIFYSLEIQVSKPNFVNPTHHVYLNLSGNGQDLSDHEFEFKQCIQSLVNDEQLPIGESIQRTNQEMYRLGSGFSDGSFAKGIDHHFQLASPPDFESRTVMSVRSNR